MAAKPYHKGHHSLVELAARENDHVIIFVSTKDRRRKGELPILGADMIDIWEEEIEKILPPNVEVHYSNGPVGSVYATLIEADENHLPHTYTIYTDPSDTRAYNKAYREKYFPGIYARGQVKLKAEEDPGAVTRGGGTPDVSGTLMRNHLQSGNFKAFAQNLPPGVNAKNYWNLLGGSSIEVVREFISRIVKKRLDESRKVTPRIRNISQTEIILLIDSLLGNANDLIFTEKLAGSHLDVLIKKDGEILSRTKRGRQFGAEYSKQQFAQFVTQTLEAHHPPVSQDTNYLFEIIKKEKRPDYIEYMVGDVPVAIEYTGKMPNDVRNLLNKSQDNVRFMNKGDIIRGMRGLPEHVTKRLRELRGMAQQKLSVNDKKMIESEIMSFITAIFGESILGGRIEGMMVQGPEKTYKIPSKEYADAQRVQTGLYTMFAGKTQLKKSQIRDRIIAVADDPQLAETDRIIGDIQRYVDTVSMGLPRGIKSFTSPEGAREIGDLLNQTIAGDHKAGAKLYMTLNRAVNGVDNWYVH